MKNAVILKDISKIYKIFDNPTDRIKESLLPFKKRYSHDFYALNNVSLTINKGETIGLIGKNGAGKSTLLKIITGVLTPSSGTVKVNGKIASLLELGAGFNPEMTGIENIFFNGTIMGFSKKEIENRLGKIVNFADIGDFINQPFKMYSSGMFARLAFAVNAFVEPDILIVDEALAVGDVRFQVKCMQKMKELMSSGCTVLFVSHDINAIRRLCSRAIWFDKGKLILDGDTNLVADKYMEFLDCTSIDDSDGQPVNHKKSSSKSGNIAEILDVSIKANNNDEVESVHFDTPITINVRYIVYDTTVNNPVLGIALYNINDRYICGLNTLLDKISIPWNKGVNEFSLQYEVGLRVLGGEYYFDVALEDSTASVALHYIKYAKSINVISNYISEGIFTIPHKWRNTNE